MINEKKLKFTLFLVTDIGSDAEKNGNAKFTYEFL